MMSQGFIKDDNCCRCNTSAIRKTTGIHQDDIVYASFHNKVSEIYIYTCKISLVVFVYMETVTS